MFKRVILAFLVIGVAIVFTWYDHAKHHKISKNEAQHIAVTYANSHSNLKWQAGPAINLGKGVWNVALGAINVKQGMSLVIDERTGHVLEVHQEK